MRIEDTDRERSEKRFEEDILASMKWLGLEWDGDLVRQSQRVAHYRELAESLVNRGLAYRESRDGQEAIKFKIPVQESVFHDLVHGEIRVDTKLFDDIVLIKSDGNPTYHWACIVDDHEMEISHVIRGEDHLTNTPKQLLLYAAMEWKPPKYVHLPLILGTDGTPLSKRHGATALSEFRSRGYLAEGLLNYLVLLGWSTPGDHEIFTLKELVGKFSIKRIHKSNARFDEEKLDWVNAQHMKHLSDQDYVSLMTSFYPEESKKYPKGRWEKLVMLYRPRIRFLGEFIEQANYCFRDVGEYEAGLKAEILSNQPLIQCLQGWAENVSRGADFENDKEIERLTRQWADQCGFEAKEIIHPLRFMMTGRTGSPGLFQLMSLLGKEICLERVKKFLKMSDT